jgi:cob(I)alamin adenosyltransferase
MMLLGASGSCKSPDKTIKGNLRTIDNNLYFVSKDFTIPYNYNKDQIFYNKLAEIAKEQNKYIELYVDNKSYNFYCPEYILN